MKGGARLGLCKKEKMRWLCICNEGIPKSRSLSIVPFNKVFSNNILNNTLGVGISFKKVNKGGINSCHNLGLRHSDVKSL